MGQSSQNENLILIEDENETNWNEMNIEEYVEKVKNGNVQIKKNQSWRKCDECFLQKLHIQTKMWGGILLCDGWENGWKDKSSIHEKYFMSC